MATVTFSSTDPVIEAHAVMSALSYWLAGQQRPEQAAPARAHCIYTAAGDLRTLTVTLDEAK